MEQNALDFKIGCARYIQGELIQNTAQNDWSHFWGSTVYGALGKEKREEKTNTET